jgi:hypothetical protein
MVEAILMLFQQKPRQVRRIVRALLAAPLVIFLWRELAAAFLDWSTVVIVSVLLTVSYGFYLICLTATAATGLDGLSELALHEAVQARRSASNSQNRLHHSLQGRTVHGEGVGNLRPDQHEQAVQHPFEEQQESEALFPLKG